ncbi:hypothetical protein AB0J38_14395 [Streptomyces sp. NPDC050095]|uniref:hypothetical protein n=1 Tax=unclassified Streptomyces TaxID=2593676 RepID=UPI0034212222
MAEQGAPYWDGAAADPPFALSIGAEEFTVPAVDTGWWLGILADGDWPAIYHLINRANDQELALFVQEADLTQDDLHRLCAAVAETVAGCTWPMAVRLAQHHTHGSHIDIATPLLSVAPHLDPLTAPLRQVLTATWAVILGGADKEPERQRLRATYNSAEGTNAPPNPEQAKGAPPRAGSKYRRFDDAEAAAAFRAASGEKIGG